MQTHNKYKERKGGNFTFQGAIRRSFGDSYLNTYQSWVLGELREGWRKLGSATKEVERNENGGKVGEKSKGLEMLRMRGYL